MAEIDAPVAPKLSTFNAMSFEEVAPVQETPQVIDTEAIQIPEPTVSETPTIVPTETVSETPVIVNEEPNISSFEMPSFDEPAKTTETAAAEAPKPAEPTVADWREAIKKVDRKELLKEAGVSDFALELDEHIKNGGAAADYLNAKARDWNQVADLDIIRDEFKAKYPNLTGEEIERKIARKYNVNEIDDDLKADGEIDLKSDAYELRQQRIERDKKLIIPQHQAAAVDMDAMTQQVLESQQRINQENFNKTVELFTNHEATQSLMQSKRVALDLGENGKFNFTVDKPEAITRALYDGKLWKQLTSNEKGEPDVALLQELVLHAANRKKFTNDLVNYGKSLGNHNVIAEGQNAKRPIGSVAKTDESPQYKQGTYGQIQS